MKKLRVKFGIDPTGKTIHLGRTVPLLRLRDFQDDGHQIVLIIGDFTARIGDMSDKTGKRPPITKEQIEENMKGYLSLVGKILDIDKVQVHYNSQWLENLNLDTTLELLDLFTVQQMLKRQTFRERFESTQKGGNPISLKEFIYPLLQGYDSHMVKADVEIGGEDQVFNMMAGRDVQKFFGEEQQEVITVPLIMGGDGEKMSTTRGNVINITDDKKSMFDAVMSIRDDQMMDYWKLCTRSPYVAFIEREMAEGRYDWRNWKMALAKTIVEMYHPAKIKIKVERADEIEFVEDDPEIYCKECDGCGEVGCDGIETFLNKHVNGKTNCLHESSYLFDIIDIYRHDKICH
jgi:tyrosyl-tRNA synthetase